ncbi:hypothetical protein DL768_006899 [Monosporascus sp. mg162]|nr:hypothetical protein DL768_006899 [Monosporascus sp. mg162]
MQANRNDDVHCDIRDDHVGSAVSAPGFDATQPKSTGCANPLRNRQPQSTYLTFPEMDIHPFNVIIAVRCPEDAARRSRDLTELASEPHSRLIELERLMRCICSIGIFAELEEDMFANNRISESIVGDEPLHAALQNYYCSTEMPRFLGSPATNETLMQAAVGSAKVAWDWAEETIRVKDLKAGRMGSNGALSIYLGVFGVELQMALENADNDDDDGEKLIDRPEIPSFGLSMVGGGRALGPASIYVDAGGGAVFTLLALNIDLRPLGGFYLQISHLYPDLNFIVQDQAPVLKQAEAEIWPQQSPEALKAGGVRPQQHGFFEPNRAEGADVYWFRHILHDWSDELCVRILAAIKPAMEPRSRILIFVSDYVMDTTRGCEELPPAPAPLPANWEDLDAWSSYMQDLHMLWLLLASTFVGHHEL